MKKTIILLTILLLALPLFAQLVQNGLVREMNSNRQPVAGVQITFEDAVPTDSDAAGRFRLAFDEQEKAIGDLIFLVEISKAGYELVNQKDFDIVKISNATELGIDVILARTGTVEAAKKDYYQISDKALLAGFAREKAAIRAKLKTAEVSQQEYLTQLNALQEQYDRQKESLDALAEKFARLNFDDVSPIYEEALKLFKDGQVDEAIAKLESSNPNQRTAQIIAEEKRLIKAQADLDAQKAALAQEKQQQIAAVRLLADMYSLTFNPQKAEQQYDQLLQLDSTDLTILNDAANFYQANHLYDKAKSTYPKIIQHPEAKDWLVANTYGHIGELFTQTGSPIDALNNYKLATNIYQKLYKDYPKASLYKENVAVTYAKLGETHVLLGNLDTALTFYQRHHQLFKELSKSYPQNISLKKGIALSYQRLGSTHTALGNLDTALVFHQEENLLFKKLYTAHPQNAAFKNGLAISYAELGETHVALGNLDTALSFFQKRSKLGKEICEAYPQNAFYKNGLAISYSNLGKIHTTLGNIDTALIFYKDYHQLEKELYEDYPQNIFFKDGLATSYQKLGDTHTALGNLDMALTAYQSYYQLEKELYEAYPQNVTFKNSLAIAHSNLGEIYTTLGNLDMALTAYQAYHQLEKELYGAHPENVSFKDGLAISCQNLGETYATLGNLDTALTFYQTYNRLNKELYESYPQNISYKNGLAISYSKLGLTYATLGNLDTALTFYQVYNQLEKELYTAYPKNVSYKNSLAISYEKLGLTYSSLGKLDSALTVYQAYNQLEKELYEAYPQNVFFKYGLALSYEKMGVIHTALGNLDTALMAYQGETKLMEELYATYPKNVSYKDGLAIAYSKLGEVHSNLGNFDQVLPFFQKYNQLEKELYAAYPQNVSTKNSLALSYAKLGMFSLGQVGDKEQARTYFKEAESLWLALTEAAPQYLQFKRYLALARNYLIKTIATPIIDLKNQIQSEPDTLKKYQLYATLCDSLRVYHQQDSTYNTELANALNNRAWYGFFLQEFTAIESDVREAITLGTDNKYLYTNLPPALLLQGKYEEALALYQAWMDKPFGEQELPDYRAAFLDDLNIFEKAGIIPIQQMEHVEAIRGILERK